jgi:hypothetical protein
VSTTDRHQQTAVRAPAGVGVRLRVLSVNYSSTVIKEKKRGPKPNVLFFAFVDLTESVACPMSCSMFPSNSTAPKIKKNEENLLNDATCMHLYLFPSLFFFAHSTSFGSSWPPPAARATWNISLPRFLVDAPGQGMFLPFSCFSTPREQETCILSVLPILYIVLHVYVLPGN